LYFKLNPSRKRNRKSQKVLYKEFYGFGMSICIRYANNSEEAKEILNDGFMKVFTNIKKYDTSLPFTSWFKTILVNTAINHYKKNLKHQGHLDLSFARSVSHNGSVLNDMSYQEMIRVVQELPPAYRLVFNMYVMEGLKHREIAQELGISVGTSKSNLSRAKEQLRKKLKGHYETVLVENVRKE